MLESHVGERDSKVDGTSGPEVYDNNLTQKLLGSENQRVESTNHEGWIKLTLLVLHCIDSSNQKCKFTKEFLLVSKGGQSPMDYVQEDRQSIL